MASHHLKTENNSVNDKFNNVNITTSSLLYKIKEKKAERKNYLSNHLLKILSPGERGTRSSNTATSYWILQGAW